MRIFATLAALLVPTMAYAADMPLKARPRAALSLPTAYPTASGFYFGIGTMGGGGSVSASVPGVNSNSLVSNQIGVGGILGYAWNVPNSQYFAALEGWFGWQNFNGSAPGFNLTGPATFTQRVMIGAPLSDIAAVFPNFGLAPPPFPPLPNGQTASNIKPYLFGSLTEDDITIDLAGAGSNRDWRLSPGLGVGMLGQLTSGSVVDVFAMTKFPQKGICIGAGLPAGQACGSEGTTYLAGLAVKW
jgi:hypothetical protein